MAGAVCLFEMVMADLEKGDNYSSLLMHMGKEVGSLVLKGPGH